MTSRLLGMVCAGFVMILYISSAQGALLSRLGGQAVYDDASWKITWISDANLAASNTFGTAGINANGTMNWDTANTWIANMNTANYLGFDDWRLPIAWEFFTEQKGVSTLKY